MTRKALGRGLNALFTQNDAPDTGLLDLDIDQLDPTEDQPRHVFNEIKLQELTESIKANGIIQPVIVRRKGERHQIIAGERRWRAAQRAGLHKIPCVVKEVPDDRVLEWSLVENIQREELNPIEEAHAYQRLIDKLQFTQEEIAQRVGKDRSSVANSLRLLKLPQEIQTLVEKGQLSMGHARALLSLPSVEDQMALAAQIVGKSLSVRETEQLVKKITSPARSAKPPGEAADLLETDRANVLAAESKLARRLGAPVKIKFARSGGAIEIKFSTTDDLTRLFDLLIQSPQV